MRYTLKKLIEYSKIDYDYYFDKLTDLKNLISFNEDLKNEPFYTILLVDIDDFNQYYKFGIEDKVIKESVKHFYHLYFDKNIEIYRIYEDGFIIKTKNSNVNLIDRPMTSLNIDDRYMINYTTVAVREKRECLEKAYIGLKQAKAQGKSYITYSNESSLEVA
jgi:GGDEF domain-containing protein